MATTNPAQPYIITLVLNWNLPAQTIVCVDSLLASDYPYQRVVVVDNGSTDESVALLRGRFGSRITLLETGRNLYFAGGNNVGLRWALEAGADWVVVLNNDTVVAPDMVSRLVEVGISSAQIGIVTAMVYWGVPEDAGALPSARVRRIWSMGSRRRSWLPFPYDLGRDQVDRGQYVRPLPIDYAVGCCMMVRRDVLTRVGLFNPTYQMYYEDADLSARASHSGYRIMIEPRARVWHVVGASAGRQAPLSCYQKTRYRLRFYRQHTAKAWVWLACLMIGAQELARVAGHWVHRSPELARARWRGLRDGLTDKVERHGDP